MSKIIYNFYIYIFFFFLINNSIIGSAAKLVEHANSSKFLYLNNISNSTARREISMKKYISSINTYIKKEKIMFFKINN